MREQIAARQSDAFVVKPGCGDASRDVPRDPVCCSLCLRSRARAPASGCSELESRSEGDPA
jgi:hypothetical protein